MGVILTNHLQVRPGSPSSQSPGMISCFFNSGGLDFTWCQSPDRGLPCPDGVFFLHIDEKARRQNPTEVGKEKTHTILPGQTAVARWKKIDHQLGSPWKKPAIYIVASKKKGYNFPMFFCAKLVVETGRGGEWFLELEFFFIPNLNFWSYFWSYTWDFHRHIFAKKAAPRWFNSWPFDSLVGGHKQPFKGSLNHSKMITSRSARWVVFLFVAGCSKRDVLSRLDGCFCWETSSFCQWLFLVPLTGGRWHIIPQLAVYTTYIPLIYCLLGGYMLPTTC